ncbi:MAG: cell division protein FtsA [Bacillota bacterium]|nr:cell division protein FtsA [Bacillota bacterium]
MNFLVGLDIGSKKIKASAGFMDAEGKIQILGTTSSDSMGIKKGVVVDIENASKSINICVSQLERIIDEEISEVYISISDLECESLINKGIVAISKNSREINESDVERVKNAAKVISVPYDKEVIGITPIQYIVDGYDNIKDPVGMNGTRLEIEANLVLANSTVINSFLKCIDNNNLKLSGLVLNSTAVMTAILSNNEKKMGALVIDVGGDKTDFYIIKDNKLINSYTLGLGGNNITNDISICCRVTYDEAEKIKVKYASINSSDEDEIKLSSSFDEQNIKINYLNRIIEARIEEILQLVKKKIDLPVFEETDSVILIGGGIAAIKNIEGFSKNILGKTVRIGIPKYMGSTSPIFALSVGIVEDSLNVSKEYKIQDAEKTKESIFKRIKDIFTDFF